MDPSRLHDHDAQEDSYHADRRGTIRADLVRRLGKICANLPEADFQSLVERMTEQKMRGEQRTQ